MCRTPLFDRELKTNTCSGYISLVRFMLHRLIEEYVRVEVEHPWDPAK